MTDARKDMGLVGVMYVGGLDSINARFPEIGKSIYFERSKPRFLPPEEAALFEPSRDWVIGVTEAEMHEIGERPKHVLVRRGVALGDVICVHGALQGILKAYPNQYRMSYQVAAPYVDLFKPHPTYVHVMSTDAAIHGMSGLDHVLSLDGLLERDHSIGEDKINRVDRTYRHFFATRPDLMNNPSLKPDFYLTLPEDARAWAWRTLDRLKLLNTGKPLVAVAVRAIQNPRNLGDGLVKAFTEELVARTDAKVLLIEFEAKHTWEAPGIHRFPQSSVLQAMALMHHSDALCTMDSGAMWMGHCVPVPMVVWFGPTPPETKVNYHPLYPDGIRSLKMWEWVGCPEACYEAAKWCDWTYKCMKQPPREKFIEDSIAAVMSLIEWNRTHGKEARTKAQGGRVAPIGP
jgi:ADP-heptose:LPS heptosyltransferase